MKGSKRRKVGKWLVILAPILGLVFLFIFFLDNSEIFKDCVRFPLGGLSCDEWYYFGTGGLTVAMLALFSFFVFPICFFVLLPLGILLYFSGRNVSNKQSTLTRDIQMDRYSRGISLGVRIIKYSFIFVLLFVGVGASLFGLHGELYSAIPAVRGFEAHVFVLLNVFIASIASIIGDIGICVGTVIALVNLRRKKLHAKLHPARNITE